ncbi:MAG: hypothetical protein IPL53_04315 [Ignavibacteria bacterium]|nr:hypothetical protein [Ignavibacteria bacterium]
MNNEVDLRPGMSCTVDIEVEKRNDVVSVPIQSVTTREENREGGISKEAENENMKRESEERLNKKIKPKEVIFVIDNKEARKHDVKTGISDDSYIEILEGAQVDQEVIKGSFKAINKELEDSSLVKVDNEIKKKKFKSGDDE